MACQSYQQLEWPVMEFCLGSFFLQSSPPNSRRPSVDPLEHIHHDLELPKKRVFSFKKRTEFRNLRKLTGKISFQASENGQLCVTSGGLNCKLTKSRFLVYVGHRL